MGVYFIQNETGNLVNFPRAEPNPLEIEKYLWNRKTAIWSPEFFPRTVVFEE